MFIVNEEKKVWWPVTVHEPVDGGKTKKRKFSLEFVIEDPKDWGDADDADAESTVDVLARVVTDWKGVGASKDEPLEFDSETFKTQMLTKTYIVSAIWNAYMFEVLAGAEAKN